MAAGWLTCCWATLLAAKVWRGEDILLADWLWLEAEAAGCGFRRALWRAA